MTRLLALLLSLVVACGDDDAPPDAADPSPRAVTVTFQPQLGAEPFACGRTYAAIGAEATTISPRDFRFYVSDVALLAADGARVPLALTQDGAWQYQDVALIDFEDFTGECKDGTPETNVTLRGTAPAGDYRGISFTLGVPEAMNHTDLTQAPAPMNVTGLWWGWGLGHIFLAVVTHADLAAPAAGTNDHYLHIGSLGCTGDPEMGQPVTCSKPNRPYIELTGFDPRTRPIVADFGALLGRSNLASSQGCHSFTEEPCAWPFDFAGLNWFTGSQTPTTQQLFRGQP